MNLSQGRSGLKLMNPSFKTWTVLPRSKLPRDKRTLETHLDYGVNSDGTKKARSVIKGYEQIPSIDLYDSFSPQATDIAICIALALSLSLP
jgi:hypothetical protein